MEFILCMVLGSILTRFASQPSHHPSQCLLPICIPLCIRGGYSFPVFTGQSFIGFVSFWGNCSTISDWVDSDHLLYFCFIFTSFNNVDTFRNFFCVKLHCRHIFTMATSLCANLLIVHSNPSLCLLHPTDSLRRTVNNRFYKSIRLLFTRTPEKKMVLFTFQGIRNENESQHQNI